MAKIKSYDEFIEEIRGIDERLSKIKVRAVEIDKEGKAVTYKFICDNTVGEELKKKIAGKALLYTPTAIENVTVQVEKIASDTELINATIYDYLKNNYPSLSIFLEESDIASEDVGGVIKFSIRLTKNESETAIKGGIIKKLEQYLGDRFCTDFAGTTTLKEDINDIDLLSTDVYESELQKVTFRTIQVDGVSPIDDVTMGDRGQYIADLGESGSTVICGKITTITERLTKTGKPFFVIHIDDTTGITGGCYFAKKSTYHRIQSLKEGDAIIARVSLGSYQGRPSVTFEKINLCKFPENFVMESKGKKQPPRNYKNIFPTDANSVRVKSVFDKNDPLPQELTEKIYVVFDLETTGLEKEDVITEFGAVKIKGGEIVQQWTTLVKIKKSLSEEITKLTGITNEMLQDAPEIEEVFPDFMKFIDGTTLVAHNAEFDTAFIRREANREDYEIVNPIMDTQALARNYLRLINYKLNTIADHFNIVFNHHRALADAYATAEIFIELMKIKGEKGE